MPSLKDVKMKIVGVRKTKQITKAMNMVASAKLRGAQSRIERFRPYAEKFQAVLGDLAAKSDGSAHALLERRAECHVSVIILATSDRGLCGGFNAMLIAKALDAARTKTAEGKTVKFICVGKKGRDAIRKTGFEVLSSYADVMGSFDFSLASGIGKDVVSGYTHKAMDEVTLIYGKFVSVARQVPLVQTLLPVDHEDAVAYAAGRLEARSYVSLGGFGGYLIVGFDHSIARMESGYDFSIQGNAFDTSSEPGVVWVMQDVNGNGEPDDEWYELRGSETGKEGTVSGYAVTYYRPAGKGMDVQWTDSEGHSGTIEYKGEFHDQDFYYPAWAADTYTLRGTLLESRNMVDDRGFWINRPYDWGYADNYGSDCLAGGDAVDGKGQSNGFRIANAMQPDGTPVELKYIDFVKVQVGVNAKSGPLGEVSTEVFSFADLSIVE